MNDTEITTTEQRAIEARRLGELQQAASLFAEAATEAAATNVDEQRRLSLLIRQACCLYAIERYPEAVELAREVAHRARAAQFLPELGDALGFIVDDNIRRGRLAEAAEGMSEAMYVLEQLPNEPEHYQVIHNLAVTYANFGFVEPALDLFDRALRLATSDAVNYTYASMTTAYYVAARREQDPLRRASFVHDGLYAATAALDPAAPTDLYAVCTALAYRAMLLVEIDHLDAALADARRANELAAQHGLVEEHVAAMAAEVIVRWRRDRDPTVLCMIPVVFAKAQELHLGDELSAFEQVEVEALWALGRHSDARAAMERQLLDAHRRLQHERTARWQHVRLGVEHRRVEALSTSDPLTGLHNRRFLDRLLSQVFDGTVPVCVAVIDLDGFKRINDDFGYLQGDRVLQDIAGVLTRVCRRNDAVARLGGDEFVMVLRDTSPGDARIVIDRLRGMVAARSFLGIPPDVRLTASVGIAVGSVAADTERVIADATEAMRDAKRTGRDRTCLR